MGIVAEGGEEFVEPGFVAFVVFDELNADVAEVGIGGAHDVVEGGGLGAEGEGIVDTEVGGDGGVDFGFEIGEKGICPVGSFCGKKCLVTDGCGTDGGGGYQHFGVLSFVIAFYTHDFIWFDCTANLQGTG